jgi:hypothetical protein
MSQTVLALEKLTILIEICEGSWSVGQMRKWKVHEGK